MQTTDKSDSPQCHISGTPMKSWLFVPKDWRRPFQTKGYQLYWSDFSQYGQIFPRPTTEEVSTFYELDDYYTHCTTSANVVSKKSGFLWRILRHLAWRSDWGEEPNVNWWRETLGTKTLRCCDLGCGDGSTLDILSSLGHVVCGVEPDSAARSVARQRGLTIHGGTAENLPECIEKNSYDVVVMTHVLEHCLDPEKALKNAVSLMKPDALMVVEVPNNSCAGLSVKGPCWAWLDAPRHLNFFTDKSLIALMKKVGLHIEGLCYCGYGRQFSHQWMETERKIANTFGGTDSVAPGLKYEDYFKSIYLLARTMLAGRSRKYDSVRAIARLI